jgi:hypothetical protein
MQITPKTANILPSVGGGMHRHIEYRREKIKKKMPKIIRTIPDTKPIFRLRSFSIFLAPVIPSSGDNAFSDEQTIKLIRERLHRTPDD